MWGHHLKRCGRWWYYFRAVPVRYRDVCFSLLTQDFSEAKLKAAKISADLDREHAGLNSSPDTIASQTMAEFAELEAAVAKFDDGVTIRVHQQD